ncbi:hypothetical protein GOV03_00735 [Candidatus Woesearchaeota archaeon]|nr:hypothetical protein [Candidatus Woesearchaeota archaeon]
MKKRVFIIHGWEGHPHEGWYPWFKQELEKKNFLVSLPQMPNTDEPNIKAWVSYMGNLVGEPNENTYFVGHSIGCQAILRYLEKLEDKKIGGVVFVAGWFKLTKEALLDEESKEIAKPWLEIPIDFEKIKESTNKFVAIFSDDDHFVPLSQKDVFKEKLGAKIIIEKGKKHMTEATGIKELKSALDSVLELANYSK